MCYLNMFNEDVLPLLLELPEFNEQQLIWQQDGALPHSYRPRAYGLTIISDSVGFAATGQQLGHLATLTLPWSTSGSGGI